MIKRDALVSTNLVFLPHDSGTGCRPDGWNVYTTEYIFDEDGFLVGKYHKAHPWFTDVIDTPPQQLVT